MSGSIGAMSGASPGHSGAPRLNVLEQALRDQKQTRRDCAVKVPDVAPMNSCAAVQRSECTSACRPSCLHRSSAPHRLFERPPCKHTELKFRLVCESAGPGNSMASGGAPQASGGPAVSGSIAAPSDSNPGSQVTPNNGGQQLSAGMQTPGSVRNGGKAGFFTPGRSSAYNVSNSQGGVPRTPHTGPGRRDLGAGVRHLWNLQNTPGSGEPSNSFSMGSEVRTEQPAAC